MNTLIWYFVSGRSLWAGLGLMGLAALVYVLLAGHGIRRMTALLFFFGMLFVFLSAAPLNPVFSSLGWVLCAGWAAVLCLRNIPKTVGWVLISATAGFVVVIGTMEYPFAAMPSISQHGGKTVYVIGDSVSSGIGGPEENTWPQVLEQHINSPVRNLAVAGATAQTAARRQLPQISETNCLIFLEIGGNDILNGTTPDQYETSLRTLLSELNRQEHRIYWFELPMLVWHRPYGRIQRQLAKEYGVTLIPRTFLADIFKGDDLTSDGIHLTQRGHDVFAEKTYRLFEEGSNEP